MTLTCIALYIWIDNMGMYVAEAHIQILQVLLVEPNC